MNSLHLYLCLLQFLLTTVYTYILHSSSSPIASGSLNVIADDTRSTEAVCRLLSRFDYPSFQRQQRSQGQARNHLPVILDKHSMISYSAECMIKHSDNNLFERIQVSNLNRIPTVFVPCFLPFEGIFLDGMTICSQ